MHDVFTLRNRRERLLQVLADQPEHEHRKLMEQEVECLSEAIGRQTEATWWAGRARQCAEARCGDKHTPPPVDDPWAPGDTFTCVQCGSVGRIGGEQ